ncbi:hypothetical protein [Candidatus Tisiphia endosymbiont of Oplodontha viridula]
METAKWNNINPWKYLQKVLDTIQFSFTFYTSKILWLIFWQ